jgi:hypothetical protein
MADGYHRDGYIAPSPTKWERVGVRVAPRLHPHPPIAGAMGPSLSHFVGEGKPGLEFRRSLDSISMVALTSHEEGRA